jgi:hypothetical protein
VFLDLGVLDVAGAFMSVSETCCTATHNCQ